jgi:hypothetical protein
MTVSFRSCALKWVSRLLLTVIVLVGISLAFLQALSGTEDVHRNGLEQAASQILGAQVRIGKLTAFNILPQFVIEAETISGERREGGAQIAIERFRVAFSFLDLLAKRGAIEDLQIEGLKAGPGFWSSFPIGIDRLEIVPKTETSAPQILLKGTYDGLPLEGHVQLAQINRVRPAYQFEKQNPAQLRFGALHLKGDFAPQQVRGMALENAVLQMEKEGKIEEVAKGNVRLGLGGDEVRGVWDGVLLKDENKKISCGIFSFARKEGGWESTRMIVKNDETVLNGTVKVDLRTGGVQYSAGENTEDARGLPRDGSWEFLVPASHVCQEYLEPIKKSSSP